jgi:hypothetical protein
MIVPMMTVPGIVFGYFGYQLTRSNEPRNIKRVVGGFGICAVIFLSSFLDGLVPWEDATGFKDGCGVLLSTLLVIPLYLKMTASVLRREGFPVESPAALISRTIVGIVCFEFYWVMRSGADAFMPLKAGSKYVHEGPWEAVGILGPMIMGWLTYKIAVHSLRLSQAPTGLHRSFRLTR